MAYSTIANESTQWNGISIFPKRGYIVSSAEAFFGLIRMSNIVVVELLSRAVIYSTARKNRSPQYIIIGRLLRQRARLSHDRLDYLQIIYISQTPGYYNSDGIEERGKLLGMFSLCGRQLMADCDLVDIFTTNISVEFQLRVWINCSNRSTVATCYFTVNTRACVG
jgi:hypothetical protein